MFTDTRGLGQHTIPRHFWLLQKKTKMGHSGKAGKGSLFSFEPEEYNKMGSHGSKQTIHNGYSHHSRVSLNTLKWHSKLFRTGESCQTESSNMRWRKCQGQGLQHNSASVRDRSRECSFVENLHHTQTPLPLRKCALDLPTQFIGQRNCGVPVCVVAQSGSVRESQAPGQTEANEHTFDKHQPPKTSCSSNPEDYSVDSTRQNFPNSMGHVAEDSDGSRSMHEVFFSTEVPQNINHNESSHKGDLQNMSDNGGQSLSGEAYIFKSKKTQRVLQDQIHKVVVNLEEVLRGLKEVHLEMKEVVQQIDQLTSSIDLGEEDSREASGRCSPSESVSASEEAKHIDTSIHNSGYPNNPGLVVSTVPRGARRLEACSKDHTQCESPPSVAPPAYPTALLSINSSGLKFNHGTTVSQIKGPKSEGNALSRSQKPPPYPLNSRTWRADKGKTPPYAGRRRLLSTTV
ncbi:uncharacterized protein LOC113532209 [Pangasianodon hypophthalmus]|uniref:uncharacterized protein LOC113532209 n=1 Tax=Pangasianodon hypophthalmus TaxID=310915 RepID=UPI002306E028|nr:uncharacterized protein LOC113532209 [Pangasianodon hypophthalmus]